jgi:hypothetical protein
MVVFPRALDQQVAHFVVAAVVCLAGDSPPVKVTWP